MVLTFFLASLWGTGEQRTSFSRTGVRRIEEFAGLNCPPLLKEHSLFPTHLILNWHNFAVAEQFLNFR